MVNINTNYIMNLLFDNDIFYFQPTQLSALLDIDRGRAYDLIQRLKNRKVIVEVENGKYLVTGYDTKRILSNPFYIATNIVVPSYVSYWSVLNYYGFTEQVPRLIFAATTKQKKQIRFKNYVFKYVHIKKDKLYGYKKELVGEFPTFIAEPEKAIIDSIDLPHYAGGINEVSNCIGNSLDTIDTRKLVDYARRFPNKSTVSRLGYLFDIKGVELKGLQQAKSTSFVLLNAHKKKSKEWNKKWKVNVNEDV
ncbi:MAG: hypothetical protein JW771_04470 [Candidatus Thermoplasmatota archaeon]|nr:hypothetical protein [Candidatus Thermoplasmatota archaeon]